MEVIYVGNSNAIELVDFIDETTELPVDSADVEVTLKTKAGVEVVGETWPLAMVLVVAGHYRTVLTSALEISAGTKYVAHIDADDGGPLRFAHYELPLKALTRTDE